MNMETINEKVSAIITFCAGRECFNCPLFRYSGCYYNEKACETNDACRKIVERNYEIIQRYKTIESEV